MDSSELHGPTVLHELYRELGCPRPTTEEPAGAVTQVLDWMGNSEHELGALFKLTKALPAAFHGRRFGAEELSVARRVQDKWAKVTVMLPPTQPIGWTHNAASSSNI